MTKQQSFELEKIRSLGLNLLNQNKLVECLDHLIKNLGKYPNDAVLHLLMGRLSIRLLEPQNALIHFNFILNQIPNNESAISGLISTHLALGNYSDATEVVNHFEKMHPNSQLMLQSKADVYEAIGNFDKSHECLLQCVRINDKNPLSQYQLGVSYLRRGELEKGWNGLSYLYDAGLKPKIETKNRKWDGEDVNTLLLIADQGLGDAIQFSRYIPWVKTKSKSVILACDQSLHQYLSMVFDIQTIPISDVKEFKSDAHLSLMQLAAFCANSDDPYQISALINFEKFKHEENKIKFKNPIKIGLALDCSGVHPTEQYPHTRRSCNANVASLLLNISNAYFYNLQPIKNKDASNLFTDRWIEAGEGIRTAMDTVKLVQEMDLIISVDTALIHIAGSMAKKAYLVLPFCNDWRWQMDKNENIWYPSVKNYQQITIGQFDQPLIKIVENINLK